MSTTSYFVLKKINAKDALFVCLIFSSLGGWKLGKISLIETYLIIFMARIVITTYFLSLLFYFDNSHLET